MTEEAQKLIKSIKQMESSLDDSQTNGQYDLSHGDLRVTYPLNHCLNVLKEKYNTVSKLHRERFEQVKSKSMLAGGNQPLLNTLANL
jgi:protein regulator of cytokinesis 1